MSVSKAAKVEAIVRYSPKGSLPSASQREINKRVNGFPLDLIWVACIAHTPNSTVQGI